MTHQVTAHLLKGARLYSPEDEGVRDVLTVGDKIVQIDEEIPADRLSFPVEVHDFRGRSLAPGYVDYHNHMLGGGGGAGLGSRVPPIQVSRLTTAGITTAVGCMGFDTLTKSNDNLLAHARMLEQDGITTYVFAGGTVVHPTLTFTGSIDRDMLLIDKVIGPGEVSLSEMGPTLDSMGPGPKHIAEVAARALMAGRLTGKSGVVNLQVPYDKRGLEPLFEIIETTGISPAQFIPSHSNSKPKILQQSFEYAKMGGWADFSSTYYAPLPMPHAVLASKAAVMALEADVSDDRILISSDGNGGFPLVDEHGRGMGTHWLAPSTMHERVKELVQIEQLPLAQALKFVTANVAQALKLHRQKGHVQVGHDADLLVLDGELAITDVFARGKQMVRGGDPIVFGAWEDHLERRRDGVAPAEGTN